MSRRVAIGIGTCVVLLAVLAAGVTWWISGQIWSGAFAINYSSDRRFDIEVVRYDEGAETIVLEAPGNHDLDNPGVLGLQWERGYGQLGEIVSGEGSRVERRIEILAGSAPAASARIDSFAFPGDPLVAHGIPFEDVTYRGEQGPLPAWLVRGDGNTWVIAVHGNTADRAEALRLLPTWEQRELPVLVITYRNDREVTIEDGARYAYGTTEWADLEGAVGYALESGAEDVILVGYSMGGAIVTSFLYRSELTDAVRAAILDSPALNLAAAGDMQLRDGGVPGWLTGAMRRAASVRYDIDWDAMNHLRHADELDVPMLVLHGDADGTAPVDSSRQLAELRPDIVTLVELPGVGHVRGWNEAQGQYLDAIDAFLDRVVDAGGAGG